MHMLDHEEKIMDWFTINPKLMRYLTDFSDWSDTGTAVLPTLTAPIFRPIQMDDVDLIVEMHQRSSEKTIFSR